jgi:hypothetical protein
VLRRVSHESLRRLSFFKASPFLINFITVEAEWIFVLKFELYSRALSNGFTLYFENRCSYPVKDEFSKILARATHEFQDIFGLLLSRFAMIICVKLSIVKGE